MLNIKKISIVALVLLLVGDDREPFNSKCKEQSEPIKEERIIQGEDLPILILRSTTRR